MSHTLTVKCTENAFTENETNSKLAKIKLPKPDSEGCSSLPGTIVKLPDGMRVKINCEVTHDNDGSCYGVGYYENADDRSQFRRLFGIVSEGSFSIAFMTNSTTEISLILSDD